MLEKHDDGCRKTKPDETKGPVNCDIIKVRTAPTEGWPLNL